MSSFSHLKAIESESQGFSVLVAVHVSLPRVHVHPDNVTTCPLLTVSSHCPRVLGFAVIREAPGACVVAQETEQDIFIGKVKQPELLIGQLI